MAAPKPKKKKSKVDEMVDAMAYDDLVLEQPDMNNIQQIEYVAEIMTIFAHSINPLIDKGVAFELMLQVMYEGLDEKNAVKWGDAIRQTQYTPKHGKSDVH